MGGLEIKFDDPLARKANGHAVCMDILTLTFESQGSESD